MLMSNLFSKKGVYERLLYNQIYPCFDKHFSKLHCGFRIGFNAQHCLITVTGKWRGLVDGGGQASRCYSK